MGLKFGDAVLELGLITEEQLAEAIQRQAHGKFPLGQIMVHNGMIDSSQIDEILAYQQGKANEGVTFGESAVLLGFVSSSQRDDAVSYQKNSQGVLGEMLVKLGYLTDAQRNQVVQYQLI